MYDRDKLYVHPGKPLELADHDPSYVGKVKDKKTAAALLAKSLARLEELQYKLHASRSHALLIVLQGMDASGKDSMIRHLAAGLNPQGCEVTSFKQPTDEELEHDFLWRCHMRMPRRGKIGIFNRSHYEDVLVARVHPDITLRARTPGIRDLEDVDDTFWDRRYRQIRDFEKLASETGTLVLKFFLHISPGEQRKRLLARIDEPDKHWKFTASDIEERALWDAYQKAYERALESTSESHAPWYVIPSDHKWFARTVVADLIVSALQGLDLKVPTLSTDERAHFDEARRKLMES